MKVPFGTITITDKAKELINQSLNTGRISSGKLVREFEERFAEKIGVEEAVAVSSGTDALIIALLTLYEYGALEYDDVVVPALSFPATGHAIVLAGFTPYFVDIDRTTFNIPPDSVKFSNIYLPVHLMGKPVDMDMDLAMASWTIEDAAEAHGAKLNGKNIGTFGDMACFSTYVAHIITTGEGGVVVTNDPEKAEILRSLRSHGKNCNCKLCVSNIGSGYCEKRFKNGVDQRFLFNRIGMSCKMNELEAAIGIGALEIYDEILIKRKTNLSCLIQNFSNFRFFSDFLYTFQEASNETIGPHAFPIIVKENAPFTRDQLCGYLEKKGIETRTMFVSMPTQHPGFRFLGHRLGDFPNAEFVANNGLHIGVHQNLGPEHMSYILEQIFNFIKIW